MYLTLIKCAFGIVVAVPSSHFTRSGICTNCGLARSLRRMFLLGPIPYALQTVRLPLLYTILEIKLTPTIFTFKDGAGSCAELHNETSTQGTLPDDWIGSTISLAVSILDPSLRWIFKCELTEGAFLSHGPLPPYASENSRRFTVTRLEQPVKLAPTIVAPQW